jgi:hypothetical protein
MELGVDRTWYPEVVATSFWHLPEMLEDSAADKFRAAIPLLGSWACLRG